VQQWLVSDNEHVVAGQLLARVSVVGETADITAAHAGCIEEILVPAGETFRRGQALARLVAF
jgi:pyruvate/2-oxoglutarate dehydrogenase complex dihydrolipoamide acyltransferase (E2) component